MQYYYHPWLEMMSARGNAVLLPPLASEGVCQGYCSTTTTPGYHHWLERMSARGNAVLLPPLATTPG